MLIEKINRRQQYLVAGVMLLFAAIYCSISLVNHYLFRTFAWDLGIYNNAAWYYSHFSSKNSIMLPEVTNLLSDHFELYPFFLSPLRFIFGSYTFLIVQIAAILFGGYGVYRYVAYKSGNSIFSLLAMVFFFLGWGIYSALEFDYHNNVVAAMFVPWFLMYFDKKNFKWAAFFFILLLIGKENMALWAVFICIGLLVGNIWDRINLKYSAIFGAVAMVYFIAMVKWIMPSLGNAHHDYLHFQFSALGKDFGEAIKTIITRPIYTVKLLWTNTNPDPYFNNFKSELHLMVLVSGGYALIFRPKYMIMLLPIYGQKLFNDGPEKWGLAYQYCIEFIPILSIAVFDFIIWLSKDAKKRLYLALVFCSVSGYFSIHSLFHRLTDWYPMEMYQFLDAKHYQREFDVAKAHQALKLIPDNVSVCAQTEFCPHLAFRDSIFIYPFHNYHTSYLVLCRTKAAYPLSMETHEKRIDELLHSPVWKTIYNEDGILIFKWK